MPNYNYFLGIDLGTTGSKILLIREDGVVVDKDYIEYEIITNESGFAEQRPEDWWRGLQTISQRLMARNQQYKNQILGIGISGQMHTHVYLDKENKPLRNAITWMDQRSQNLVNEINADVKKRKLIFESTGNYLTTTYSAPQIAWIKENETEIYQKTAKILLAKDYLKFLLTGEMLTDNSDAAGTLLFNVQQKAWADELFDLFGIEKKIMPEVAKSAQVMGKLSRKAALATGLPEGIPVINGSADHAATSLGAGVIQAGQASAIIGTAGVISVLSDTPNPDPEGRTLCWNYCLDDKWVNLGIMQTAGESLQWFKDVVDAGKDNDIFANYNEKIARIPAGSENLIFLPYLMGERTPYWNPDARGIFFGLSLNHQKYHLLRSIMEGVAFALKNNLEAVESLGIEINELRILGGGSKSPVWIDILSKILTKKLIKVKEDQTGALGSAILTGLALGVYPSLESAVSTMIVKDKEIEVTEIPKVYQKNYLVFKELYKRVEDLYCKIKGDD